MQTKPAWMTPVPDKQGFVAVDADAAYGEWHKILDQPPIDQYWLEVMHTCIKLDVQFWVRLAGIDPRPERSLVISIAGRPGYKQRWGQKGKSEGRMADLRRAHGPRADRIAAMDARAHYKRIRGVLPE